MRKVVFGLVLLLLTVIVVEVFLYLQLFQKQQATTIPTSTAEVTPTPIAQNNNRTFNETSMLSSFRINYTLKDQGILVDSKSEYTYHYEIIEVEIYSTPQYVAEVDKNVKAVIKYKTQNDWVGLTLTEKDIEIITFEDQKNPGSLNTLVDLQPGDTIQYTVIFDPLLPPAESIESIHITRN